MIAAALAAAILGLPPGGLEITGDSTCPTAADVSLRLTGLLRPTAEAPTRRSLAEKVRAARATRSPDQGDDTP
jgi:hypothetical protein